MTNQEYIKAINLRRSRRTYCTTALDDETKAVIREMVSAVNESAGLKFEFIDDAASALKIFTGRFSAIAICAEDTEKARIKCGYYGESIVLQCAFHGFGTCWVTGTYDENKILSILNLPKEIRLYGLIVVGYVKDKLSSKEKIMYKVTHKKDIPYQKMIESCDEKLPECYEYAMKLVEKAPSETNSKPVRFRYENGVISAYVKDPYSDKSISFGIAQLHFCIGTMAKGVKGSWDFTGKFIPENECKVIKFHKDDEGENKDE